MILFQTYGIKIQAITRLNLQQIVSAVIKGIIGRDVLNIFESINIGSIGNQKDNNPNGNLVSCR